VPAFLFKTEPSAYSYADLARDKRGVWDGVSNALALIHLRTVRRGDSIVIYHSGADKAAVGLARAVSAPYADPKLADARRVVVDLAPVRAFARPVPLARFRSDPALVDVALVRNSRLSVMPLAPAALARLLALAEEA
jgi:predicted RNA-binding protein with PUA-like domain